MKHLISKKTLLLTDTHFPYQNNEAIKTCLADGKKFAPDTIILNGDIIDFYSLSRFVKDPKQRNLKNEIDITTEFLSTLRNKFPKAKILFKSGNHENRLKNFIYTKSEEFADLPELSLKSLLHLKDYNIEYVPDDEVIQLGKLSILHGHEAGNICSTYPARSLFMVAKTNAIAGHCHRQSSYVTKTISGETIKTYTQGCLCELAPDYSRYNEWCNGYAIIDEGEVILKAV